MSSQHFPITYEDGAARAASGPVGFEMRQGLADGGGCAVRFTDEEVRAAEGNEIECAIARTGRVTPFAGAAEVIDRVVGVPRVMTGEVAVPGTDGADQFGGVESA